MYRTSFEHHNNNHDFQTHQHIIIIKRRHNHKRHRYTYNLHFIILVIPATSIANTLALALLALLALARGTPVTAIMENIVDSTTQSPAIAACPEANITPQSNKKQKTNNGVINLFGDAVDRLSLPEPQSPNNANMDSRISITARTPPIAAYPESNLTPQSNKKIKQ